MMIYQYHCDGIPHVCYSSTTSLYRWLLLVGLSGIVSAITPASIILLKYLSLRVRVLIDIRVASSEALLGLSRYWIILFKFSALSSGKKLGINLGKDLGKDLGKASGMDADFCFWVCVGTIAPTGGVSSRQCRSGATGPRAVAVARRRRPRAWSGPDPRGSRGCRRGGGL